MKFEIPNFFKKKEGRTKESAVEEKTDSVDSYRQRESLSTVVEKIDRDKETVEKTMREIIEEGVLEKIKANNADDFGIIYLKSTGGLLRLGKDSKNRLHLINGGISKEGDYLWELGRKIAKRMEEEFQLDEIVIG